MTLIWIGFGFTDLTFENHVSLTSIFSKKSLQASSMSVTLTVTLTPRRDLTLKRKKMHGTHISVYGLVFITRTLVSSSFVSVANLTNFHQMTEKFRPQQ